VYGEMVGMVGSACGVGEKFRLFVRGVYRC
jgi:hypothetical protein